jgi:hypothetical protein
VTWLEKVTNSVSSRAIQVHRVVDYLFSDSRVHKKVYPLVTQQGVKLVPKKSVRHGLDMRACVRFAVR